MADGSTMLNGAALAVDANEKRSAIQKERWRLFKAAGGEGRMTGAKAKAVAKTAEASKTAPASKPPRKTARAAKASAKPAEKGKPPRKTARALLDKLRSFITAHEGKRVSKEELLGAVTAIVAGKTAYLGTPQEAIVAYVREHPGCLPLEVGHALRKRLKPHATSIHVYDMIRSGALLGVPAELGQPGRGHVVRVYVADSLVGRAVARELRHRLVKRKDGEAKESRA